MFSRSAVVLTLTLFTLAAATDVQQCPGRTDDNLSSRIQLSPCKKLPCKLKKGTDQHITIKFTPDTDLADVKNKVTADVFGVELPFVGVDGLSICDKIYTEAGDKAPCPLKAGTNYVYKDSFPILSFYPNINVNVHWSIQDEKKDIICFHVPAKIVN